VSKYKQYIILLLLLLPIVSTNAQDHLWTFKEQCATHASINAWAFAGTILLTGYGGLHGVNADWDTPRVLARIGPYSDGYLSPDNRWYAEPEGHIIYSESYNHEHIVDSIEVYSTRGDNIVYSIPWQNSWLQMWGYREMFWINNDHILYEYSDNFVHELDELVAINPFEDARTAFDASIDILDGGSGFQREYVQFPAPDFTRTIYSRYDPDRSLQYWGVYDIASGQALKELQVGSEAVFAWLPGSSGFAGQITTNDERTELALFDRNGELIETIYDLGTSQILYPQNIRWSSNGQYLAFKPSHGTLLIADTQTREVVDTCLSTGSSFAWSLADAQISYLEPGDGVRKVYVFDLPSSSFRAVAHHIVQSSYWAKVIGWRED
jgi:hypothetical protein